MNFEKYFLPKDIKQAKKEFYCTKHLLNLIEKELERGDFIAASYRMVDALQSISELAKMSADKHENEQINALVTEMIQKGIDIQIVRRKIL